MERTQRHSLIKRLQTQLPRGMPFDSTTLKGLGISAQLAASYVKSGWLVRLGRGVFAFQGDDLNRHGAIKFLQTRVPGLHVGGKNALALQGVHHNLSTRNAFVLWGQVRFTLPDWFTSRYPARYVSAHLFDWENKTSARNTL